MICVYVCMGHSGDLRNDPPGHMSYGHKCHHPGPGIRFWLGKHHCKTVSRDMALCADMEQKHMEQHLENDILHILSCHIYIYI